MSIQSNNNLIQFKRKRIKKGLILSGMGGAKNENGPVARELSDNDLMYYGLYWDNIIVTQIPLFSFTNEIIEQFRSNGVIDFYVNAPPERGFHSSQMQALALESLIACQSVKKQDKSIDWLIYNNVASGFNNLESDDLLEEHAIRIEIAQCLPYPSTYVPIDVLRSFREKYIDELDRLHYAQYKLFELISNYDNNDRRELARLIEITEFNRALDEYQAAFAARFTHYNLKSIITDIRSNKPSLWELGAIFGDMALAGGSLSGAFSAGKILLNIFGTNQKVHEAKANSPQFHFISSAIEKGIILQKFRE